MKPKYAYAIVYPVSGTFLLEDGKLPIYWNKKTAQKRIDDYFSPYEIKRIDIEKLNKLIK